MSDYMKMINLRNKLDMDFYNILGYDPEFSFYGSKQEGEYSFYIPIFKCKGDYRIELNFKIYYEDKMILLDEYNKYNSLDEISDEKLEDLLTDMQNLANVRIDALYITPTGIGLGSKIVNALVNRLKEIDTLSSIYLYPADNMAEKFWAKQGFKHSREEIDYKYYGWRVMNDWFYELNE
ncbi:MAG: hypothetical protein SO136_06235 [Sarcina ventriculi]|nr:hypothetical protein [Sarcina ventriculi]MDY7062493.1 hypothetical protein [Sarcina ventriculi]